MEFPEFDPSKIEFLDEEPAGEAEPDTERVEGEADAGEPESDKPEAEADSVATEKPEAEEPGEPEKKEEPEAEEPKEVDFDALIGERSGGKFAKWEEVEGKLSKLEQLEALDIDDEFVQGLLQYRKENGDVAPYLEAKTVDYDTLDARELYRRNLIQDNPEMNEKAINRMLKREYDDVVQMNADLNELEPEEVEDLEGERAIIEAKVSKLRKSFKDQQSKFAQPKKEEGQADTKTQEQREAELEYFTNHPDIQALEKSGKLTFKVGDKAEDDFNLEVDPKEVKGVLQNPTALFQNFILKDEKGKPQVKNGQYQWDVKGLQMLIAIAKDVNGFTGKFANHAKSLGKEAVENELENPASPSKKGQPKRSASLADSLKEAGIKL
jgi:sRNA-binding protein